MRAKLFLPVLHFSFLLTGVATTMLGALLPFAILRWAVSDAQAGALFGAQFGASTVGSSLYGFFAAGLGNRVTVIIGLFTISLGVVGFALSSWPLPLLFVAVYGFGLGIALPAINLLVASMSPHRRSAALSLANFFWTLGAVIFPLVFVYFLTRQKASLSAVLIAFSVVVGASAIGLLFAPGPRSLPQTTATAGLSEPINPRLWILTGLLLFLYVGVENGVPGWTPTMGLRQGSLSAASIAFALALYWGALLLGRLAASFLWSRASAHRVITVSLSTALAGIILLATSNSRGLLLIGLMLTGGGLAAIFPTAVAVFSTQANGRAEAGIVFAAAGFGGAVVPPLIGVLSTHGYALRIGVWLMAGITAVMMLIELGINHQQVRLRTRLSVGALQEKTLETR